ARQVGQVNCDRPKRKSGGARHAAEEYVHGYEGCRMQWVVPAGPVVISLVQAESVRLKWLATRPGSSRE
ncbi:hypothetical protein, partial [Ornithinimicrobium cerasi]|uniref:hypothetical protein n=1 Tax=Ornithinimicrobium cerasi TaxID=2248773 RepID=UPI001F345C7F